MVIYKSRNRNRHGILFWQWRGTRKTFVVNLLSDGTIVGSESFTMETQGDPLKEYSWHLENFGQNGFAGFPAIHGVDLNLEQTIQQGITGKGVRVAVSDSGLEIAHPDLTANVDRETSLDYTCRSMNCDRNDPTPAKQAGQSGGSRNQRCWIDRRNWLE